MATNTSSTTTAPEQLALLSAAEVPHQFRLDQRTRQRGLAHIAAIKAQLAQLAATRDAPDAPAPVRRAA